MLRCCEEDVQVYQVIRQSLRQVPELLRLAVTDPLMSSIFKFKFKLSTASALADWQSTVPCNFETSLQNAHDND